MAAKIPKRVVRWLERTVRQDELNHVLTTWGEATPMEFLRGFFEYAGVSYEAVGLEEVPMGGRYVFAANHPFGGMDGMMLAEVIGSKWGNVKVVVNDILMYLEPLAPIFVPVNKHGAQGKEGTRAMNEAFAGGGQVLTFPAGLCSRRVSGGRGFGGRGEVCDLEWRPNFVKRAVQTGREIVPVYVEGRLSKRFYRLAEWRKRLGIKANVEMLLLPDEMFRQRGKHFKLIFGAPITVEELAGIGDYYAQAQEVKRRVYELVAGEEGSEFRGKERHKFSAIATGE